MSEDNIQGKRRVAPGRTDQGKVKQVRASKKPVEESIAEATRTVPRNPESEISKLIESFAPKSQTIDVTAGNSVLHFATMRDRKDVNRLRSEANQFAKIKVPKEHENYDIFDTDEDTLVKAYILAELSKDPKFEPEHFLTLAKHSCAAFDYVFSMFAAQHDMLSAAGTTAQMEAAKKRIENDPWWKTRLIVARDAFHAHPTQLETGSYEDFMLIDMVALALVEQEEAK